MVFNVVACASRVVTVFCDESAKWEHTIHLCHVHKFKCFKANLQSAFKLDLSKRNLTKPDTHYWQLASLRLCVAERAAGVDGIMYSCRRSVFQRILNCNIFSKFIIAKIVIIFYLLKNYF